MRITKRTNIAIRLLMFCATNTQRLVTKSEVAASCNVSENHLAQVINQLGQLGYLNTVRGRKGGMSLAKPATEITVGSVFRDIEGTLPPGKCFADVDDTCPLISACRLTAALARASQAFYASLDEVSVESLVFDNVALLDMFQPAQCTPPDQSRIA